MSSKLLYFIIGVTVLSGCSDRANTNTQDNTPNKLVERKGKYVNGKFNGVLVKFTSLGDTLSKETYIQDELHGSCIYYSKNKRVKRDVYIDGSLARSTSFDESGKIKKTSSFILGTNTVNSFVSYDAHSVLVGDNSNITLTPVGSDSLLIGFYAPFPDRLELIFKPQFSSSKVLDSITFNPFKADEVLVKLSAKYYFNGTLNLIVRKKWSQSALIQTQHETFIQLSEGESVDPNNLDPIVL